MKLKDRAPRCAKCKDRGWMSKWTSPGFNRTGNEVRIPCPKNCLASRRWKAESAASRKE